MQRTLEDKETPLKSTPSASERLYVLEHDLAVDEKAENSNAQARIALYEDAINKIECLAVENVSDSNLKFRILISVANKLITAIEQDEAIFIHPHFLKRNVAKLHSAYNVLVNAVLKVSKTTFAEGRRFIGYLHSAGMFVTGLTMSTGVKQADLDLLVRSFSGCVYFANLQLSLEPAELQKLCDAYDGLAKHSSVLRDHFANDAKRTQERLKSKSEEEKFALDASLRATFHAQGGYDDEKAWQVRCEKFSALTFPCGIDIINMKDLVYGRVYSLLRSQCSIEQLLAFLKLVIPYQSKFQLFDTKYNLNFLKEMLEANEVERMALFDSLFSDVEMYASQSVHDLEYFADMLNILRLCIRFLSIYSEIKNKKLEERYHKITKTYYLHFRYIKANALRDRVEWFYGITELLIPKMNATNLAEDNNLFLRALLCLVELAGNEISGDDKSLRADIIHHLQSLKLSNTAVQEVLSYVVNLICGVLTDHYEYYNKVSRLLSDNEEIREEYYAYIICMQRNRIKEIPDMMLKEAHKKLLSASEEYSKKKTGAYGWTCEFIIESFENDDVKSTPTILFEAYFRLGVLNKSHEQLLKALEYKIENPSRELQIMIAECHARLGMYFKKIDEKQAREYCEAACGLYNAIMNLKQKPKMQLKCEKFLEDANRKVNKVERERESTKQAESKSYSASARHVSAGKDISIDERHFLNAKADLEELLNTVPRLIKSLEKDKQATYFERHRQLSSQFAAFNSLKPADGNADEVEKVIAACTQLKEDLTVAQSVQDAKTTSKGPKWTPRPKEEKDKERKDKNETKTVGVSSQRKIVKRLGATVALSPPVAQTALAAVERKHDFLDYTVNRLSNLVAIYKQIQAIRALRVKGSADADNDLKEERLRLTLIYNLLRICVYYKLHFNETQKENEKQLLTKLEDLRSMLIHQGAVELLDIDVVNLIPEFLQDFAREFKNERRFDKVHEVTSKVAAEVDAKQIPLQKLLQALHTNDRFTTGLNMQDQLTNVVAHVVPLIQKISQPFIQFATDNDREKSPEQIIAKLMSGEAKAKFTSHMQALKLLFSIVGEYYEASAFEQAKGIAKDKDTRSVLNGLETLINDCRRIFRNTVVHCVDDGDSKAIYDMALCFQTLNSAMLKSVVYQCFKMPEMKSIAAKKC